MIYFIFLDTLGNLEKESIKVTFALHLSPIAIIWHSQLRSVISKFSLVGVIEREIHELIREALYFLNSL
jgi:hypothetical protein